jgi:hypothetical protein
MNKILTLEDIVQIAHQILEDLRMAEQQLEDVDKPLVKCWLLMAKRKLDKLIKDTMV